MITFLGTAHNAGCVACASSECLCQSIPSPTPQFDNQGRQVFVRRQGVNFIVVVEAQPESGGAQVGTTVNPTNTSEPPDLLIQVSRNLGNGDAVVDCRSGAAASQWGGVPAINPPDENLTPATIQTMTDFACRFTAQPIDSPCTLGIGGDYEFVTEGVAQLQQFCRIIESSDVFPNGDTIVSARVRDKNKNIGPTKQIVIRVQP